MRTYIYEYVLRLFAIHYISVSLVGMLSFFLKYTFFFFLSPDTCFDNLQTG